MRTIRLFALLGFLCMTAGNVYAQEEARHKPFSFTIGSVTITGTYSEGYFSRMVTGGVSILGGLFSWGGSESIECRPGAAICRIEQILSISAGLKTDGSGNKGFEETNSKGGYPVVVSADKGKQIRFAVDIQQLVPDKRMAYTGPVWTLEQPFVLAPAIVRELKLYDGPEEMGFLIPAGKYPLFRDGNIYYWTWEASE